MKKNIWSKLVLIILLFFCKVPTCSAYSVLTHEALIDAAWDNYLAPLLKQKYSLTADQLKEAHAYAYGGAVSPDMGYYPFGSKLYTNLVHYVRSGDYVDALLNEAQNANEYAFALGALCHYYADSYGHHLCVNVSVPIVYPRMKKKFGDMVTYEDDPTSHKRVEFAFDVVQTAKGNYASQAYHDFIGFKVSEAVMEKAFYKTYSLHLKDVFTNLSRAVETFRWSVKNFFPALTKAAWVTKKKQIKQLTPGITARQFKYTMSRANYNKEFGKQHDKPNVFSDVFAIFIRFLPKIGPLKSLKFKTPGAIAEKLYIESFDSVEAHYTTFLKFLFLQKPSLVNKDFDTGQRTTPGEYALADKSYQDFLFKLADTRFAYLTHDLKQNLIDYFNNPLTMQSVKEKCRKKIQEALTQFKMAAVIQIK